MLCELTPEGICAGVLELYEDEGKRLRYGQEAGKKQLTNPEEINKLLELMD
jgi:hypothetical protein